MRLIHDSSMLPSSDGALNLSCAVRQRSYSEFMLLQKQPYVGSAVNQTLISQIVLK